MNRMANGLFLAAIAVLFCFGPAKTLPSFAEETEENPAAVALADELREEGLTENELENVRGSVSGMLEKGAGGEEIKKSIITLVNAGLRGRVLSDAVIYMSELVDEGESVESAGKIVHETAIGAMKKGIKGKNLTIEIKKAVTDRKQETGKT